MAIKKQILIPHSLTIFLLSVTAVLAILSYLIIQSTASEASSNGAQTIELALLSSASPSGPNIDGLTPPAPTDTSSTTPSTSPTPTGATTTSSTSTPTSTSTASSTSTTATNSSQPSSSPSPSGEASSTSTSNTPSPGSSHASSATPSSSVSASPNQTPSNQTGSSSPSSTTAPTISPILNPTPGGPQAFIEQRLETNTSPKAQYTVVAYGLPALVDVTVTVHSDPIVLTLRTDQNGQVYAKLNQTLDSGDHTVSFSYIDPKTQKLLAYSSSFSVPNVESASVLNITKILNGVNDNLLPQQFILVLMAIILSSITITYFIYHFHSKYEPNPEDD